MSDTKKMESLSLLVNLIVDIVFGDSVDASTLSKGDRDMGKAFVSRHIFFLDNLVGIHPKILTRYIINYGPGMYHSLR